MLQVLPSVGLLAELPLCSMSINSIAIALLITFRLFNQSNVILQVLHSMGLQAEVPLCSIKLSAPESRLLEVKSDDLLQLPKTPQVCYPPFWRTPLFPVACAISNLCTTRQESYKLPAACFVC